MRGIRWGCVRGVGQKLLGDDDWPSNDHGTKKAYTLFAIIVCNIITAEHSRLDKSSLARLCAVLSHELNCLSVEANGRSKMTVMSAFNYSLPIPVKYKKELYSDHKLPFQRAIRFTMT